jgi:hypothetical protein
MQTADNYARLYRPATLVALRRGRETYETAALPLSYVGARPSIGDEFRQGQFVLNERAADSRHRWHSAADSCCFYLKAAGWPGLETNDTEPKWMTRVTAGS